MSLINNSSGWSGIYRGIIVKDDPEIRIYIPALHNNTFGCNSDELLAAIDDNRKSFPLPVWCAPNIASVNFEDKDVYKMIFDAIVEEPPIQSKEGGIIKEGYNSDIDYLRNAKSEGKNWLAELENTERERTGIKNLRVKFNKVFGYYLEVTNSYLNLVPDEYIRKQTLTNAERFTTVRLKELEDTILNAEDK